MITPGVQCIRCNLFHLFRVPVIVSQSLFNRTMSPFPEEPLDLTREQGAGYFLARSGMLLKDGRYRIIRKLGYGSRSSVWLVDDLQ